MLINGHCTLCLNKRAQSLRTARPSVYGRKISTLIVVFALSKSKYNNASCTIALTQLRIRFSFSLPHRFQSRYYIHLKGWSLPVNDWGLCGWDNEHNHLLRKIAHSRLESEWRTLQKNAWLRATLSIPSRTGMLSACVEYIRAGIKNRPCDGDGAFAIVAAINDGFWVSSARWGPKFIHARIYARPRRALDVNGIGPFSFEGSRLDSGACFHTRVQARSARLCIV